MANTRTPARTAAPAAPAAAQTRALSTVEARERHPLVVAIDERMPDIARALPKGLDPARFQQMVIRALIENSDLLAAEPTSVLSAIMQAAEEGIEPTGASGGGYLVVFAGKAQLIRDYRAIARAIIEAGAATRIDANVVRPGDEFDVQLGSDPRIVHRPALDAMDKEPTHYYAVAWLSDGTVKFEVMTHAQVDHIRSKSRAKDNGPWRTDYVQMGRKTVIKRLANYLPFRAGQRQVWREEDEVEFGDVAVTVEDVAAARTAGIREKVAARRQPAQLGTSEQATDLEPAAKPAAEATAPAGAAAAPSEAHAPSATDAPARRRRKCTHPADKRVHREGVGVVCGIPDCGEVLAAYEPAQDAEPPADAPDAAQARPRPAQAAQDAPAAQDAADDGRNVMVRRLHAQARSRGLDHTDLKVIVAAVAGYDADRSATYSSNDVDPGDLEAAIGVMDELPTTCDMDSVSTWVYPTAAERGLKEWADIDLLAASATGHASADELTVAEWIAWAIRLSNGEYDTAATAATEEA